MDATERERIERLAKVDRTVRTLYEEHRLLDKKLAKLSKKPYLTAGEEREEQRLKRLKLQGKDRMMRALAKWEKAGESEKEAGRR